MKDQFNISRAFGLGEIQRSENDQESVRAKGVCIDSTHGTTGYDFLLTTVMVTDEC